MSRTAWIWIVAAGTLVAGCAEQPPAAEPTPPPPTPPTAASGSGQSDGDAIAEAPPAAPAPEPAPEPAPAPPAPARPEQGNGPYRVSVASERTATETEPWMRKLQAEGFSVSTEAAEVEGTTWQRVVLPGLRNGAAAREMVAYLESQYSMKSWVIPKNAPTAASTAATEAAPAATPAADATKPTSPAEPGAKPEERPEN
jgi:hypothetical protein